MNSNRRLIETGEDIDIFAERSPIVEEFLDTNLDNDPRRKAVVRQAREALDTFFKKKHSSLNTGFVFVDKILFIQHKQDKVHISFKDPTKNTAVSAGAGAVGLIPGVGLAAKGASVVANTATNSVELMNFFKANSSELEKWLNEKCKGFTVSVDHDFLNYLTLTLKEKSMRIRF